MLFKRIESIINNIFEGDVSNIFEDTVFIIEDIMSLQTETVSELEKNWNIILQNIMNAMQNRDYLLIADLLQFEILPYFNVKEENHELL